MKRIVAVIFEDGTEAAVADMKTIVRYVAAFRLQRSIRKLASNPEIDWEAHGKAMDLWKAEKLRNKAKKHQDRSKPRGSGKDVTPHNAVETLEQMVALYGPRGASKAAARKLKISKRTLNRRLAEAKKAAAEARKTAP